MRLRIVCKAKYLSILLRKLINELGEDFKVIDLNSIISGKGVKVNVV
ncbi:hypothetical protein [Gottschalkia purinilytica]|nr:hypothetical protein [Gottschalkia purinilytica]